MTTSPDSVMPAVLKEALAAMVIVSISGMVMRLGFRGVPMVMVPAWWKDALTVYGRPVAVQ